ncbi:hypothetical protein ABZS54_23645, partial [Embleya sp. NPDC005575]
MSPDSLNCSLRGGAGVCAGASAARARRSVTTRAAAALRERAGGTTRPASFAGVLMYADGFGIRPVLRELAHELAGHGYYVLV